MTSYDPALPTDRDWVRFLIGDTSCDTAVMDDGEIDALVTFNTDLYGAGVWVRWLAAADALCAMASKFRTKYKGVSSKSVSKLSISYGGAGGADGMEYKAEELRKRGNELLYPNPKPFAVFRTGSC